MQVNPLAAQVTASLVAGFLALILTPLLWALLAGVLAGGTALCFATLHFQPDLFAKAPSLSQSAGDVWAYCAAMADHLAKYVGAAWGDGRAQLATAAGVAGGLPFIVGAIRLRLATIVMSSLCGGVAIAAGIACLVCFAFPTVASKVWSNWFILGGAGAAFALAGIFVQYRRAIKADKDQKNREGEPPEAKKADGAQP
jgi:hypothetical protein